MISYDSKAEPHVQWNHVDGPLLVCCDGALHWLTRKERIWLRLGLITLERLNAKYGHGPYSVYGVF